MKEEGIDEQGKKILNPDDEIPFSDEDRVNPGVNGLIKEMAKLGDKRVYQCAYGIIVY